MNNSEPVIVFYKSPSCSHCRDISNIWDTPPSNNEDSIVTSLKRVNSKIRFFTVTAKNREGSFDENLAPKDLFRYANRLPQILLIPGKKWDAAMAKLGSKNDIKLIDGVKIMNAKWENGMLKENNEYNMKIPSEYEKWLKACYDDEEFKTVQFNQQLNVPIKSQSIIKDTNLKELNSKNKNSKNANLKSEVEYVLSNFGNDSCGIRIIEMNNK